MEETVNFDGKKYTGIRFELGNVPLLILKVKNGYVACSYIDRQTAEKLGDIACFVSGVKTYDELYKAKVKCATQWAEDLGIREGMSVKKALELIEAYEEKR